MSAHLRANLWLLGLTVLLCSVIYPAALWVVGRTVFAANAEGSLIYDSGKKSAEPIGSRLIAHEVKGDQYFQPRPSATSGNAYNAAASGASNWAANNYQLRDRAARALAPVVKYGKGPREGQPVAADVVRWFRQEQPGLVAEWAGTHAALAQAWAKSDDTTKEFVQDWFKQRPADFEAWQKKNPGKKAEPEELAVAFFEGFSREHPATWLTVAEIKDEKGKLVKRVALVEKEDEDSADIASVFFDMWRDTHPDVRLTEVPADMVTASASGLDPHITLKNALYQLPRVADKWAELTGQDRMRLRGEIETLLRLHASAPMFGLAGVKMVNVIEMNALLHQQYGAKVKRRL